MQYELRGIRKNVFLTSVAKEQLADITLTHTEDALVELRKLDPDLADYIDWSNEVVDVVIASIKSSDYNMDNRTYSILREVFNPEYDTLTPGERLTHIEIKSQIDYLEANGYTTIHLDIPPAPMYTVGDLVRLFNLPINAVDELTASVNMFSDRIKDWDTVIPSYVCDSQVKQLKELEGLNYASLPVTYHHLITKIRTNLNKIRTAPKELISTIATILGARIGSVTLNQQEITINYIEINNHRIIL